MSKRVTQRLEPQHDDDVVLFLVGFRINRPWKIKHIYFVVRSFIGILKDIKSHPEVGCLGHDVWWGRSTISIQYWASYQELLNYARDRGAKHFPNWYKFNLGVARSGDVGLWHEIYTVPKGSMEAVYRNFRGVGLGKAVGFTTEKGPRILSDNVDNHASTQPNLDESTSKGKSQ